VCQASKKKARGRKEEREECHCEEEWSDDEAISQYQKKI
jgi:hypothetical protein